MLLKTLSEAHGVSGDEGEVRQLILNAIRKHVDEWRVDSMGNLIALKRGTGETKLKGIVAAHMDEVGFMVVGHDSQGYLQVEAIGGVDDKILPALRVRVGGKKRAGVFMWKPIHLGKDQAIVTIEHLRVDIGADSKESAARLAPVGTRLAFDSHFVQLSEDVVRGKAFDDRAGCAELVELCQGERLPFDLYACFTVQEEVGLRGATVLVESIAPDFALVLEAIACHETPQDPDEPDQTTVTRLGGGAVLSVMDARTIAHPGLLRHFINTAEDAGLPYQFRSPQFAGGTDAGALHLAGAGVPALSVSLPCRYLHSPHLILSLADYRNTLALVTSALHSLTPQALARP